MCGARIPGATLADKAVERVQVLHESIVGIIEERAKGLHHTKAVQVLRSELKALSMPTTDLKTVLVQRLEDASASPKVTWKEINVALEDLLDSKWKSLHSTIRSKFGIDNFPVGLADNGVAMAEVYEAVKAIPNIDETEVAEYMSALLLLDQHTSLHPLTDRCDADWLNSFLEEPAGPLSTAGFSLKDGPQMGMAIHHSLKYLGRLYIYKTVLYNKLTGMRMAGASIVEMDALILQIYGNKKSHLNFVYGYHVSWPFRNVEGNFALCRWSVRCLGHIIAGQHEHYSHLKPRTAGDMHNVFRHDVCSNDLNHLVDQHMAMYLLPLLGQLLAGWNLCSLYHVNLRYAPFMEAGMVTAGMSPPDVGELPVPADGHADTWHPPMALAAASDYTVEHGHIILKKDMANTAARVNHQQHAIQRKFQLFQDDIERGTKSDGPKKYSGPPFERGIGGMQFCGSLACPCVLCGLQANIPIADPADDLSHHDTSVVIDGQPECQSILLGGHVEEDDPEEESDDSDAAAGQKTPQETNASNLAVVTAEMSRLGELAGTPLHLAVGGYLLGGQPVPSSTTAMELAGLSDPGAAPQALDGCAYNTWLKAGKYALSLSLKASMVWSVAVVVTVANVKSHHPPMKRGIGIGIATIASVTVEPADSADMLQVALSHEAWTAMTTAAPAHLPLTAMEQLAKGQISTNGKPLLIACICDANPTPQCINSNVDNTVLLGGELTFDQPLGASDNASKVWRDPDALDERLPVTKALVEASIASMFDTGTDFVGNDKVVLQTESAAVHRHIAANVYGTANTEVYCGPVSAAGLRIGMVIQSWFKAQLSEAGLEAGLHKLKWMCEQLRSRGRVLPGAIAMDVEEAGTVSSAEAEAEQEQESAAAEMEVEQVAPTWRQIPSGSTVVAYLLAVPPVVDTLGNITNMAFGELTAGENTNDAGEDDSTSPVSMFRLQPTKRCDWVNVKNSGGKNNDGLTKCKEEWEIPRRTLAETVPRENVVVGLVADRAYTAKQMRANGHRGLPPWSIPKATHISVFRLGLERVEHEYT